MEIRDGMKALTTDVCFTKGAAFEAAITRSITYFAGLKVLKAGKSGTNAVYATEACAKCKAPITVPRMVKSKPDFEGTLNSGRHLLLEAKVESGASLPLTNETHMPSHQRKFLLERSTMNALTGILVHFNPRTLKKRSDPSMTVLLPVHPFMDLWREVERAETKRIDRERAEEVGVVVEWALTSPRHTKPIMLLRPALESASHVLRDAQMGMNADAFSA